MPIKFPCPHCKKVLSVKDHLAGKKGPCPACKKILTVPLESSVSHTPLPTNGQTQPSEASASEAAAAAPPPIDAEAAAAAALADEPPPPEVTAAPQFLDFNCPFCDEALHMGAEVAGKRVPCPECKRIIKVPELKKIEKADWRKTNAQGLPSGARRPDEPVPEGAWGTATSAGTVSREALEEADVLPDRYEVPLTVRQKVTRGVMIATACITAFVLVGVAYSWWSSSRESRTLKTVQDYANSPAATEKIGHEGVAALQVSIGEYHLRAKKPHVDKKDQPQAFFNKALEALSSPAGGAAQESERDAILADLALLQTDLGGSKDEVDLETRLSWDATQGAIGKTLRQMHNPVARLEAYRAVCRRLLAKNQAKHAVALAKQLGDSPNEKTEAVATAGLELLAANQNALAETAAQEVLAPFMGKEPGDAEGRPPLTPAVIALAVAVNASDRPMPGPPEQDIDRAGQAEGLARLGKWDEARAKAAAIENSFDKLQAYIALAAAGEAKSDNPDLQAALKLAPGETQQKEALGWLKLRLVELAVRAGVEATQLDLVIASLDDRALAGRARLAVLQHKLASKSAASDSPLLSESPPTLSHYLAVEMVARHSGKYDAKADEADRSFGIIGTLLRGVGP